jgi:glycosyltransferase involved in cell wall biosynthesis
MDNTIYFDLTPLSITTSGTAVYTWEVCHRLMRLAKPLQVIPYTCPFKTLGKSGIHRVINSLLRETISYTMLTNQKSSDEDYFIAPTHNVPKQLYKRKYAVVVHDLAAWHNPAITSWGGRNFAKALPGSIKNAHQIFAVSEYTAQDIAKGFNVPLDSIIVATNGLSEMYKSEATPIEKINGIEIPPQYFLHTGIFDPKKNLPFLLKVYERFREITRNQGSFVKLVLTGGEKAKNSNFIQEIRNSPYARDILVLGRVSSEELPSLYRGATAFVFPSTFEGFGMPVIEALSQGTPVLINSNTSLTQFGEFGSTLFDNFEVDIWAKELETISQTKNRVAPADVEKVRQYFDWDRTAKIVAKTIGLIDE